MDVISTGHDTAELGYLEVVSILKCFLSQLGRATNLKLQHRLNNWAEDVFNDAAFDPVESRDRFLEEAIELYRACGGTKFDIAQIMDYVFNRPDGEIKQEIGGTLLTLMALCTAHNIDLMNAGETELTRVNDPTVKQKIRTKHLNKPRNSPLPGQVPSEEDSEEPIIQYIACNAIGTPLADTAADTEEEARLKAITYLRYGWEHLHHAGYYIRKRVTHPSGFVEYLVPDLMPDRVPQKDEPPIRYMVISPNGIPHADTISGNYPMAMETIVAQTGKVWKRLSSIGWIIKKVRITNGTIEIIGE